MIRKVPISVVETPEFVSTTRNLMSDDERVVLVDYLAHIDMTQEEFAGCFGFSVNTLRHWEQGSRQPEGPTRAYLLVIDRAPKAVRKALQVG